MQGTGTANPHPSSFLAVALLAASMLALPGPAGAQLTSGEALLCPDFDIGIVLDKKNLDPPSLNAARQGISDLMDAMDPNDRTALWSVPSASGDKTTPTANHGDTKTAAASPPGIGSETLRSQLQAASTSIGANARNSAHQLIIVVSDGKWASAVDVADAFHSDQYRRIAVIATSASPSAQLQDVASQPSAPFYLSAPDQTAVGQAFADLSLAIAQCGIEDLSVKRDIGPCWPNALPFSLVKMKPGPFVNVTSLDWYWGDGQSELGLDPAIPGLSHEYPNWGLYTIRIELREGNRFVYGDNFPVSVPRCPPKLPVAAFDCSADAGPGTDVVFTDKSTKELGTIVDWKWEVGDGNIVTGQPSFTHVYLEHGLYAVKLTVTDSDGFKASAERTCRTLKNEAPVIQPIADVVVHEGETVKVKVTGSDPDGDVLAGCFRLPAGMPTYGVSIQGATLHWETKSGQAGEYGPIVACLDDGQVSSETSFSITVLPSKAAGITSDGDGDGVADHADNCPNVANTDQRDRDGDGLGDVCDTAPAAPDGPLVDQARPESDDADRDGVPDALDNCPTRFNKDQLDRDGDGWGDVCDSDRDGDGVPEGTTGTVAFPDNCPDVPNPMQQDADKDGVGDHCEKDIGIMSAGQGGGATDSNRVLLDDQDIQSAPAGRSGLSGPAKAFFAMLVAGALVAAATVAVVRSRR